MAIAGCLSIALPAQHRPFATRPIAQTVLQDETDEEEVDEDIFSGLSFGLNLGSYFASRNTANFYNGACLYQTDELAGGVQCVTIAQRLDPSIFLLDYNNILNNINNSTSNQATGFFVPFDSYPINMRYNPAMYVGLQLKYGFNRTSALLFNLNAVRLRAVDQFTLQFVGSTPPINGQNDTRLFQIYGREQRFNINIGYRQGFEMGDFSNFYLQFGGSMLGTSVQQNQIRILNQDYSLFMYTLNINTPVEYQARTNVGFGFYVAPGFEFFINGKYGFDLSLVLSRDRMNLNGWTQNGWNSMIQASFNI
jgi:hypothetical protein